MNGKTLDVGQVQRFHAQDDAGQRRAQHFRIGEARPGVEIRFVVQADADALRHPAAAAGPLVGRCLRDLFDLQLLDLVAVRIALDPRQPGVDHVADARHGQRGFGHVGRQHDAPLAAGRLEDAVLLASRQAREQRQDFRGVAVDNPGRASACLRSASAASRISRSPGRNTRMSPLPSRDTSSVASTMASYRSRSSSFFSQIVDRPVAHLDRVEPARHLDHRRRFAIR